jgi:hypothetical protein
MSEHDPIASPDREPSQAVVLREPAASPEQEALSSPQDEFPGEIESCGAGCCAVCWRW